MSLALLFHYLLLNMFRVLIHPSSGACDLFDELMHGLYCSVRIVADALVYLFSGKCLVVMCVVVWECVFRQMLAGAVCYGYWVFFVCGMFLIMFPAHILMSYIWAYTYLVRCVLVLRCGGVVSTPHHHNITPTHIEPEQYNPCINSSNKSQAPEDGCINIWNKLSSK